jgi:hypothetical protein
MDNAQKAIMIGVGLFITIIIIAAVMAITGMGTDLLNKGQNQLGGISGQLEQQLTAEFNNVQMSGSQVLAAINRYYNDGSMIVALYNTTTFGTGATFVNGVSGTLTKQSVWGTAATTHAGTTIVSCSTVASTDATRNPITNYTTNGNTDQILATARYKAVLIQNSATQAVMGIAFIRL